MKARYFLIAIMLMMSGALGAQQRCDAYQYMQQQIAADPSLRLRLDAIETFTRNHSNVSNYTSRTESKNTIRIPVVVHVLYHTAAENISDAQIQQQLNILNKCFRRQNPDTVNTPSYFKTLAADAGFEFVLATSDPRKHSTSGIIRKYTPVALWQEDDKMKFSSETGDDAWDCKSYLNIWVCNLDRVMGYSTIPGGPADKDGLVIGTAVFGGNNDFTSGKTVVHEAGHWLNLKHLWGDAYCGDDGVADTPKQSGYNISCPTGIRKSCGNDANGDMYMNYMDFTSDACMNMFSAGQVARMRVLFDAGGARSSILSSTGLDVPAIFESPLPADDPRWMHPQLYPNPASSSITLDVAYDARWVGKSVQIANVQGQVVMTVVINSKYQQINISNLKPGIYFMMAKKDDGATIKEKFVRM